jgi:hypothetical protein
VTGRSVEITFQAPATLADVERFCSQARRQGASDDDEVRIPMILGWVPIRGLKVTADLAHNREQAYRADQGGANT